MTPVPELFVHRDVAKHLIELPARPWEVGGWLLGYWGGDERGLFVTQATPPTRGSPLGVTISGKGHRPLFDVAWEVSGGHVTFLGDWHTHPGQAATPSRRDARALARLAANADFGTSRPLIAIVAAPRWPASRRPATIRYWLGEQDRIVELNGIIADELPTVAQLPEWPWPTARRYRVHRA